MAKTLRNMMGAGLGAETSKLINGVVFDGLTATGSTQADALMLFGDVNVVSTVPAGTGVLLPAVPQPSDEMIIANLGANALNVYPALGSTLQGGSANSPYSLSAGASAAFIARKGSQNWIVLSGGGSIALPPLSTAPSNTSLPFFMDDADVPITAPLRGTPLWANPGVWNPGSSSITSYTYQVNLAGVPIIDALGTWVDGNYLYIPLEDDLTHALSVTFTAHSADGTGTATSTPTSAVADPVPLSAIIVTRLSANTITPISFTAQHDANTRSGPNWQDELEITDPSDNSNKGYYSKEITQDEFTSNQDYWNGTYDPQPSPGPVDFSALDATYLFRLRTVYLTPDGANVTWPWSDYFSATDVASWGGSPIWNTSTGYTRSGSNLIATRVGSGSTIILGDTSHPTGYFEAVVTIDPSEDNFNWAVGIGNSSTATWLGVDGNSIGYHKNGHIWLGGSEPAIGASLASGDVIGVAIKLDGSSVPRVYFRKNGLWQASLDPALNNGIDISGLTTFFPAASSNVAGSTFSLHVTPATIASRPPGTIKTWG